MKKHVLSLLVLVALVLVGCEQPVKPVVTIEPTTLTLLVGDTSTLNITVSPAETVAEIVWSSSNSEVASVDANGVVVALAEGTANITASIEGAEPAICSVIVEQIPSSFPRKYLIEHFTGDQCGYCPYGMYSIVEYTKKTSTPCIWVSHHYGYKKDEYTISESTKIGSTCGVQEAPSMAMNRTKVMGNTIAFPPGYLVEDGMAETIASKCQIETEASVNINHKYDAASKQLNVTINGLVANTEVTEYLLTVLIKENGLVGAQADYYWSWKIAGYREFMHPCVARDVISESQLGDTVKVEKQRYSKTYTYTVSDNWVAENCCVVAYITPLSKKPIINAEETPLVAGTTGGAEYLPFAITEKQAPTNATKLSFKEIELNKPSNDKLNVKLIASNATRSDYYGPLKMVINLEFNTPDSTLPVGTYEFAEGNELNTFSAGTVDYATQTFGASLMQYCLSTDLTSVCHTWRIKSGSVTVNEDGSIVADGKMDNGKNFAFTYTPAQ